jgi:ubiquitin-conjugating enzyme E2 variant
MDYPSLPPEVSFNSKINLPCVNQSNGRVEPSKFSLFSNWKSDYTMEKVLIAIKNEMIANKKLPQPPEGDTF